MTAYPHDVAYSAAIRAVQERLGSRAINEPMAADRADRNAVTPELAQFLATMDMCYLGTSSAAGKPYIQYRGGPLGFIQVLDQRTLAFADFAGNRQYISLGNLSENAQAFLFLIDYVHARRVKIWGNARVIEDDPALLSRLSHPSYRAQPQRVIAFTILAWDPNCPRHIHQRLPATVVTPVVEKLQARIADLEGRLRAAGLATGDDEV